MKTLYLIKSNNYLKIGIAKDINNRLKKYKTHNPDFKVLYTREGTYSDEYFLHKILDKYKINDTEWMVYDEHIIEIFKTIKLNHEDSVSKSNSKKRIKHVQKIIKDRKKLKEANTIHITKNGIRKTYY